MVYILHGSPVVPVPIVGNLVYDELGKEVLRRHNERFDGIRDIEDRTQYQEGQPISFSNTLRALSFNQILDELGRENGDYAGISVLTLEETIRYFKAIPKKDSSYADTSTILVFPKEGANEELRRQILDITYKSRYPLLVDGLTIGRINNDLSVVTIRNRFRICEAPYLRKDCFIRNTSEGIEFCKGESFNSVRFLSTEGFGLKRIHRYMNDIISRDGMLSSDSSGLIQLKQVP